MPDRGFAIRCPSCRGWSIFDDGLLEEAAISSADEFNSLMKEFERAKPDERRDNPFRGKLFFCKKPHVFCPAPFEAVVHKGVNEELKNLPVPESWSFTRHFNLFKADTKIRWNMEESKVQYCGILFNTQPVQRLRYGELETLMNRELVSRLIAGICVEIDSPLTIFAAKVYPPAEEEGKEEVYWMPIEGYSQEKRLVPPRYSLFCETCRGFSMQKLSAEFNSAGIGPDKCPSKFGQGLTCLSQKAPCLRKPEPDWDHCPVFLKARSDNCPCYNSDLALIEEVGSLWEQKCAPENGVRHTCHAGFHEVAFPLVVHGHLVGVAITGQLFLDSKQIKRAEDFIKSKKVGDICGCEWSTQVGKDEDLEEARDILIGLERKNKRDGAKTGAKTVFLVDGSQLKQKIDCLRPNLDRFEKSAESQYTDLRTRSEAAFRRELLGFIENHRTETDFFKGPIKEVVKRMQEFWSFKCVYLLFCPPKTEQFDPVVIARSILGNAEGFGVPTSTGGQAQVKEQELHAYPHLRPWGGGPSSVSPSLNKIMAKIEDFVNKCNAESLKIQKKDCGFVVVVPTIRGVYTFVLAVRDRRKIACLKSLFPEQSISDLCQDMIFETCNEIVGEFHTVKEFAERETEVQIRCLENMKKAITGEIDTVAVKLSTDLEAMRQSKERQSNPQAGSEEIQEQLFKICEVPRKRIDKELESLRARTQSG
ncbi:MAG: PocR ligand-binding domain-containing protein [Phycisphaerales bacterium]